MSEATSKIIPISGQPPFRLDVIDLTTHPDGDLLRLCASLQRLRGQLETLERAIAAIPAVTVEGRSMKACSL